MKGSLKLKGDVATSAKGQNCYAAELQKINKRWKSLLPRHYGIVARG
jgi:hypothetical protein